MSTSKRSKTPAPNEERLFEVHVKEYETLRQEYLNLLSFHNSLINYAIAIIGASATLFAVGNPPFAKQYPYLLLVASLLLTSISWTFLETYLRIRGIGDYLKYSLSPRIQKLVGDENKFETAVFRWYWIDKFSFRFVAQNITAGGKFAVAFIPSILFIVAFYFQGVPAKWTELEQFLFWTAVGAILLLPLIGLANMVVLYMKERTDKKNYPHPD